MADLRQQLFDAAKEGDWEPFNDLGWCVAFQREAGRAFEVVTVYMTEDHPTRARAVTGGRHAYPNGDVYVAEDKPVFENVEFDGRGKRAKVFDALAAKPRTATATHNAFIRKTGCTPVLPDEEG